MHVNLIIPLVFKLKSLPLILLKTCDIVPLETKREVIQWKQDQLGQADASVYCSTANFIYLGLAEHDCI